MTSPHDPTILLTGETPDGTRCVVIADHHMPDEDRIRFYVDDQEVGRFETYPQALNFGRNQGYLRPLMPLPEAAK